MNKIVKRKRSPNWDILEKHLLQVCICDHLDIIENKNTDTNTNHAKNRAWISILKRFNELNAKERLLPELKQQWRTIKMDAKKDKDKTRGGEKTSSSEPIECEEDSHTFDSDGTMNADSLLLVELEVENDVHESMEKNVEEETKPVRTKEEVLQEPSSLPPRSRDSCQSNSLMNKYLEEEHKLKMQHMNEVHAWASKEADLRYNNLLLENKLLRAKLAMAVSL